MEPSGDYYAILGVEKTAGDEEIRAAYHARVVALDGAGLSEREKIARVKLLTDAFVVLSDVDKRWVYDKYGRASGGDGDPALHRFAFGDIASFRANLLDILVFAVLALRNGGNIDID